MTAVDRGALNHRALTKSCGEPGRELERAAMTTQGHVWAYPTPGAAGLTPLFVHCTCSK